MGGLREEVGSDLGAGRESVVHTLSTDHLIWLTQSL